VIAPADFRAFISERFRSTGKRIADEGVDAILELTGGHPYAKQELCYFTWEATPARRAARRAEVSQGLDGVLRSEHAHFSLVWDRASSVQRVLLAALGAEPGHPYSQDYRRRHRLPPQTNVQRALTALGRNELVAKRSDGTYAITEPFLAQWVGRA
jgi:hypothetical protein